MAEVAPGSDVAQVAGGGKGEQEGESGHDWNSQTPGEHDAEAGQAEHEADGVHRTQGLGFGIAQGDEAVMDVFCVGAENGHAADGAANDGEGGVEDRNAEGDEDDEEGRDDGAFVVAHQGDGSDEEADEIGAAIAEEDFGWGEIEDEETREGTAHDHGDENDIRFLSEVTDEGEGEAEEHAEASGETVHAIDEIDDVGDGDEPEESDGEAPPTEVQATGAERIAKDVNGDAHGIENQSASDLTDEFDLSSHGAEVIQEADAEHEGVSDDDGIPRVDEIGEANGEDEEAEGEGDEDGNAAETRDGNGVLFAVFVRGVFADLAPVPNEQVGHEGGEDEGSEELKDESCGAPHGGKGCAKARRWKLLVSGSQ